ncbi:MAG: RHS repeat-associated core domain-containing protein [Acidobacteria bacterium]|jgi:RHS repeat-associated protein|nr:RHS repeat-associated core domain-containing protein [Acidobacteriota bacterium]
MRLEIPNGQNGRYPSKWTLYMPDGGKVVSDVDASGNPLPQKIYDENGNYVTPGADQFGRYIARNSVSAMEDHITKLGFNGELLTWKVKWKYISVIKQYTTSEASDGIGRGGTSSQVLVAQLRVVDEIETPVQTGGLKYTFAYNAHDGQVNYIPSNPNYSPGWGEILSVNLPSGAKAEYDTNSSILPEMNTNMLLPRLGKVSQKRLVYNSEYDGNSSQVTETWNYSIGSYSNTITGPDGGQTSQSYYTTATDNDFSGRVYKETKPDGTIIERIWKNNQPNGFIYGSVRRLNTYVKTEFTTIPNVDGSPSLTAIKDYSYDKNGNVTQIKEYEWIPYSSIQHDSLGVVTGIPSGYNPVRTTENTYYNQTPDASDTTTNSANAYWNTTAPNIRNAISSTEIKTGGGTPVSRSEMFYDNYSTTGNLTETKVWDSFKNGANQPYSNPLSSTNSISMTVQYDQYGNPTSTTDAKGNQTQITYGAVNGFTGLYPTQTIAAYGMAIQRTSTAQYDFYTGLITSTTDVDNNVSSGTDYDALGRPVKVKAAVNTPQEVWARTEYNDAARRVIVRSDLFALGDGKKVSVQHYDQLGRVRLSRTLEDSAQDTTNESLGIKVQTRYQTGNPNSYQLTSNPYRAAYSNQATNESSMGWTRSKSVNTGKHSEIETFLGAGLPAPWGNNTSSTGIVQTDIDADRVLVTDQGGKQRISRTNALGQLTDVWEVTSADAQTVSVSFNQTSSTGYQTSYEYDTLNNLTKVIQGTQQTNRNFTYSSLSRLLSATNPESGTISYQYDLNGNLTKKTDARLIATNYSYDELNRVKTRSYTDGITPAVSYTYDNVTNAKGLLTKVTNGFSTTEYLEFDNLGRVKQSRQTTDGVAYNPMTYTYYLSGALKEQTYPSGRVVKNTLDADGDLSKVETQKSGGNWQTRADLFTYTAAGAVSSMQLGNGRWESTIYNSRLQPTQIALGTVQNGTDLLKLEYSYNSPNNAADNNGNVQSQTITVPNGFTATQNYTYDSLNRIKQATETINGGQSWKQTFLYDRYGNRNFDMANTTTLGSCSQTQCNPTIDTVNNRFTSGQGYTYDLSGNVKTDAEGRNFIYDAENKQKSVTNTSGTLGTYHYDGDGKRVKKVSATETTIFIYDAFGKLVAEYSNQTSQTPQVSYLTTDNLGSPRINTDQNGNVIARHDYHPFGEEINRASYGTDDVRNRFTTYERDIESDLDYAQARYYGYNHGRFTSPDPLMASATSNNPQSWNRYIYTFNNPLKYIDPTGMVVDDYFINRDGSYVVVENDCKCDTYYIETEKGSGEYRGLGTLQENDLGLVEFPAEMNFFGRYGTPDKGGGDHGAGDHFVKPEVAAGLFGLAAVLKDEHGITINFGDMSSSNGRDPWEKGFEHHKGHGHDKNSGLDIDFRYINKDGVSFPDPNLADARSSSKFSVEKNQTVYDAAETFGFTDNFQGKIQGKNTGLQGVPTADKHNDHGHLGFVAGSRRVKYAQGISVTRGIVKPLFFKK